MNELAKQNTPKGRAARRTVFRLALVPDLTAQDRRRKALSFVLDCIRRVLKGEDPSSVFSCGRPGPQPAKAQGAKLRRARAVGLQTAAGMKKHFAIAAVAKKYRRSRKTIRDDLKFAQKRKHFKGLKAKVGSAWLS